MNTQPWTIWLVLLCAFLGSLGQLLFKLGSKSISFNVLSWITNWQIMGGMALYGISSILFITALKYGNLSILYPIIATTYVWVAIFSVMFLREPFALTKWIGVALIIGGVISIVK
ncbi:4-amino-4-deoxy-L-arabinose-phosphoundecaprenol flippase subunit ArnE [subsurface metagenome]